MTNALTVYENFDNLERAAIALFKSGYFPDAKSQAQAMVKVMAGAEVGIAPFASMTGINVIQGKPGFGSNLIATLVDNDPRYAYKIKRIDEKACIIEWFKNGEIQGESKFTIEEARSIKQWNKKKNIFEPLANKLNWQNYPSDMLFARAITRGQKRFAAGVAGGAPIYTVEELGADEDELGNIIDIQSSESEADPQFVILEELGFDPESVTKTIEDAESEDIMTIEKACNVKNSEGTLYMDIDNDKLSKMTIGISKGLKKPDLTPEKKQEYLDKRQAIKVILQARADGSLQ